LTTNVAEGSNLYYLDSRVQSFVNSSTTIPKTYTSNTFTNTNVFNANVGIGTSSPYAPLSVVGQIVGAYFTGTTTATSTLGGGLQANLLNITSTTATSTFGNGISLSNGCFLSNGSCLANGISSIGPANQMQTGSTITLATRLATSTGGSLLSISQSTGYPTYIGTSTLNVALSDTTGTLAVNRGGTNITNPSAAGVLLGSYAGGSYQQLATSSLGLLTTNVAEGSNLYYTDARVNSYIDASTTIPKTYTNNTYTGLETLNGGLTVGTLNGPLDARNGVVGATSSVGVLYGGTGLTTAPTLGQILVGNSSSGYTLSATSTFGIALSDTTGTLAVNRGGTNITNPSAAGVLLGSYAGGSYQQLATSSLGLLTTNVAEGSNLYYLDSRVQSFVHGSTTIPKTYTANNFTSTLAVGSTTPFGLVAINPTGGQASNEFVIGSSSATAFIINNNGNVGIGGTTTAAQVFSVLGNGYLTGGLGVGVATTSAGVIQSSGNIYSAGLALFTGAGTSTFGGGIQGTYLNLTGTAATSTFGNGISLANGCFFANGSCLANGLSAIGPTGQTQTGPAIILATSSTAFNGLTASTTITATTNTITFANTLAGLLTAGGGGTGISNPTAAGILLGSYAGGSYQQLATSSLGLLTTNVAEGSNLYYTDARVQAFVHGSTTIPKTYTNNTYTGLETLNGGLTIGTLNGPLDARNGVVGATTTISSLYGGTGISSVTAAGVLVGNYTGTGWQQLATSSLGLLTTNVAEGSNLYYLDSRVQSFVHGSTTIPKTYTANTFTGAQTFTGGVTIGTLNGPLDARNGVVGATSSVGVLYGGTGLISAPTLGQTLVGNASSGYTLSATSTFNIALSDTTGTLAVNRGGTNITNPSAAGVLLGSYAGGAYQQIGTSSLGLLTTNVAEGSNLYYLDSRVQSFCSCLYNYSKNLHLKYLHCCQQFHFNTCGLVLQHRLGLWQ
jgi:hypothetical protein